MQRAELDKESRECDTLHAEVQQLRQLRQKLHQLRSELREQEGQETLELRKYGGAVNHLMKEYVKEKKWEEVTKFCTSSLSNPRQADIYYALKNIIESGDNQLLERFFTLKENSLTEDAVTFALNHEFALDHAVGGNHRSAVYYLCTLEIERKPDQETVSRVLTRLVNWNFCDGVLVADLCSMTGVNKPNAKTIEHVLEMANLFNNWELVQYLCHLKTDSQPNKAAVEKILSIAVKNRHWEIVQVFCNLQTDNRPDAKAIENVLEKASMDYEWELVESLCNLKTDSQPNQTAVERMLSIAVRNNNWKTVKVFCNLQTDNRPNETAVRDALERASEAEAQRREARRQKEEAYNTEREEARRKQEQEAQKKQVLTTTMTRINLILETLRQKIDGVNKHCSEIAYCIAKNLLSKLESEKSDLYLFYSDYPKFYSIEKLREKSDSFKEICAEHIMDAKPRLENDLGWGDFLINLLKSIANAFIAVVTIGYSYSYFNHARTSSIIAVEEAEQHLVTEPCVAGTNLSCN